MSLSPSSECACLLCACLPACLPADYRQGEVSLKAVKRGFSLVFDYGATILLVPTALLGLVRTSLH